MSATLSILRIQRMFDLWRELGCERLANNVELVAAIPTEEGEALSYMHVIFPGMVEADLKELEARLGHDLPSSLRLFYGGCGGLTLFSGGFLMHGLRRDGFATGDDAYQPDDIVLRQHMVARFGWKPEQAVAFASNCWDNSVNVIGMSEQINEVLRCELHTGRVLQRYPSVFECIDDRLHNIDQV